MEDEKANKLSSTRSKSGRKSIDQKDNADKKSPALAKDKTASAKSRVRRSSVMSAQKVNVRRSSRFFQVSFDSTTQQHSGT